MSISIYYNRVQALQLKYEANLNTWANHLIVLFAFFVPVSMGARMSTSFLIYMVFLLRGRYLYYVREGLSDKLLQAFALYFAVHVIWLVGTEDFVMAKKVLQDAEMLLYPLLFVTFIDKRYLPRMTNAFFLGMMVSELWSYGIFLKIFPPPMVAGGFPGPTDPTPVYNHSHYGFMLAVSLVLIFQRFIYEKDSLRVRILMAVFFVTASINLFITAGRIGYVLFVILLLTVFLLYFRKNIFKGIALGVLLIATSLALAFNFSSTFHQRYINSINSINSMYLRGDLHSSIGYRIEIYKLGLELVKEHWMFGVGAGDQMDSVRKLAADKYPKQLAVTNYLQHFHNEYLSSLVQFGILGLLAFLFILYRLVTYDQDNRILRDRLIVLAVATSLFAMTEIVVIGLGALLTLITLVSFSLSKYFVDNARFYPLRYMHLIYYFVGAVLVDLVSKVT